MTHVSPDILDPDPAFRQQGYVRVSETGRLPGVNYFGRSTSIILAGGSEA
jgi:hypothetical protein